MALRAVNYAESDVRQAFERSLRETGVVILRHPPIDSELITAIYREWHEFFQGDAKHGYLAEGDRIDGYFPPPSPGRIPHDHKEFFHIYPGGRYPAEVSAAAQCYAAAARALALELLGWLDEELACLVDGAQATVLRIQRYLPSPHSPPGTPRGLAHTDINMITLLSAPAGPGLQVLLDDRWVDVSGGPDSLIIQAGEMLDAVTGAHYPAALHRVVDAPRAARSGSSVRMSMPLFVHAADEAIVSDGCTAAEFRRRRRSLHKPTTSVG
jgi:isopenicillin N synthase-like dioxygenase